jgi:hypothetical protein
MEYQMKLISKILTLISIIVLLFLATGCKCNRSDKLIVNEDNSVRLEITIALSFETNFNKNNFEMILKENNPLIFFEAGSLYLACEETGRILAKHFEAIDGITNASFSIVSQNNNIRTYKLILEIMNISTFNDIYSKLRDIQLPINEQQIIGKNLKVSKKFISIVKEAFLEKNPNKKITPEEDNEVEAMLKNNNWFNEDGMLSNAMNKIARLLFLLNYEINKQGNEYKFSARGIKATNINKPELIQTLFLTLLAPKIEKVNNALDSSRSSVTWLFEPLRIDNVNISAKFKLESQ